MRIGFQFCSEIWFYKRGDNPVEIDFLIDMILQ